jgi:hypothetical protein
MCAWPNGRLVLLATVLIFAAAGRSATAAVRHEYLPAVSAVISEGVPNSSGAGVTGPLSGLNAMTVDEGSLWIGESIEGSSVVRVDSFNATTGAWETQLTPASVLREPFNHGLAVGHATGEAELYLGSGQEGVENAVVAVFGPAGTYQNSWLGSDTPEGSFGAGLGSGAVSSVVSDESAVLTDWASGDIYVGVVTSGGGVVDVFKPKAGGGESYVTQIKETEVEPGTSAPLGHIRAVAVDDANGDVFVLAEGPEHPVIDILEPVAGVEGAYKSLPPITETATGPLADSTGGLAVDGVPGNIYASSNGGVDEFRLEGETTTYLDRITGPEGRGFHAVRNVAVDRTTHDVYVGDFNSKTLQGVVDVFSGDLTVPDAVTSAASAVTPTSATLNGTVNPDEAGEATCRFLWGTTRALEHTAPCSEAIANGGSPVPVTVAIGGLTPDTTYFYRLEASNGNGLNPGNESNDREFATPGPGVTEEWASEIASTSVTLHGLVDPDGAPTSYFFEYGTTTAYGRNAPASPGSQLGAGHYGIAVEQHIQGLLASHIYHFRLVAISELSPGVSETFFGPDQTLSTEGGGDSQLADSRHWQQVTPPEKHAAVVEPIGQEGVIEASASGGAITYFTNAPTEERAQGYANYQQALAVRNGASWTSHDISIPHASATGKSEGIGEDYRFFSNDLSEAIAQPAGPFIPAGSPQALAPGEASEQTAFLRTDFSGGSASICESSCFRPLVTGLAGHSNVPPGTEFGEEGQCPVLAADCGPKVIGASPSGGSYVVASASQLTPVKTSSAGLYEWHAGTLTLVSVLPTVEGGQAATGPELGDMNEVTRHAVSNDGSRVIWGSGGHLYLRDHADTVPGARTLRLDTLQGGSGAGPSVARFQIASSDDSRVFFTDPQRLTANSKADASAPDLYECLIVEGAEGLECKLSDLTPAIGESAGASVGVVLGASEDGSVVYFVSNGTYADGSVSGDCIGSTPAPGAECNLYVRSRGTTKLVAVLSANDNPDWARSGESPILPKLTARVSPNGEWLAFMSERSLTGYDNRDAASNQRDQEVYLYHARDGSLRCVSCDPTGQRPSGMKVGPGTPGEPLISRANIWIVPTWLGGAIPGWTAYSVTLSLYQSRYLNNQGRLFFDSPAPLVPRDVNKNWDVYEYEPAGVGACTPSGETIAGGCVGVVSGGGGNQESVFVDASESGADAFFITTDRLVSSDFDTSFDLYDAHECALAAPCGEPTAVVAPGPCAEVESCRQSSSSQQAAGIGPTSAPSENGNVKGASAPRSKPLTRAQKLQKALAGCRKLTRAKRRMACTRAARKKYGAKTKWHRARRAGNSTTAGRR